jgi:Icc-related predicted phosphoesterase
MDSKEIDQKMQKKIVCISDLHGNIPPNNELYKEVYDDCDFLIIAGDITNGSKTNYVDQAKFLNNQFRKFLDTVKAKNIVGVFGNHDTVIENFPTLWHGDICRCQFLCRNTTVTDGVKIWGSPYQPFFYDWSFQYKPEDGPAIYENMPDDCDIVINHGPPFGFGDRIEERKENIGCTALLTAIMDKRAKNVVCGHVHEGFGQHSIYRGTDTWSTNVYNASLCDSQNRLKNPPIVFYI